MTDSKPKPRRRREAADANEANVATLVRRGLTPAHIAQILEALREEQEADAVVGSWPTSGSAREAVVALADDADLLRTRLAEVEDICVRIGRAIMNPAPRVNVAIGLAAFKVSGAVDGFEPLALQLTGLAGDLLSERPQMHRQLRAFASALRARLAQMRAQDSRGSHAQMVARIAAIIEDLGFKESERAGSRFHDVVAASFALAGVRQKRARKERQGRTGKRPSIAPPNATAAIRSYLGHKRRRLPDPMMT